MITFSKLGRKGRLGNQLFQIASTAGLARKNDHSFFFPNWDYEKYFEYNFPLGEQNSSFIKLKEKKFPFHAWEIKDGNYDLDGWLQTELYFDAGLTQKLFTFEANFEQYVLKRNKELFKRKTVLISVRRGDFVHSNLFFQLPFKYYFLALFNHFPDWEERNLIFASDDIEYCQFYYGHLKNAFFLKNRSPMEQLVIGTHCDDFIISNSTFSWWIAWLGEKKGSKVICPIKNFRERIFQLDDRDFYPARWSKFDHRNKILPLSYFPLVVRGNLSWIKSYFKHKKKRFKMRLAKLFK